ncbi:phosphoribosylformylglycinamidine cyclo-ligase [candidate division WOR-3 bacterium]|nr:phosphoribosylformylglycinamidine cyclo-ligase [candidate division WOR-3 bacterium]
MKYEDAGVNIGKAGKALEKIKNVVKSTFDERVVQDIGNFGALFSNGERGYLVSSADGVGTKLKVAFATGEHSTVGQDLVNHCVNDIFVLGAIPMFFLDYIATGSLDEQTYESLIGGLAKACRENSCSLIGGETAEMPGFYSEGEYDIAGFIVGEVAKEDVLGSHLIKQSDVIYGIESSGLHTNGYSLARKILKENNIDFSSYSEDLKASWGEALLKVHRSYLSVLKQAVKEKKIVSALAHITGGGIKGNLERSIPKNLDAKIQINWTIPPIFKILQKLGGVPLSEMFLAFNMGIGMICSVPQEKTSEFERYLMGKNENIHRVGLFEEGTGKVTIEGIE